MLEQALRRESPFRHHLRSVPKDTRLGDVDIPAAATVLLLWGAANRDPAVFERPDEVVLGRHRRHVAFGRDIHYCVGAALARLEARVVLTVLLEGTSSITLDPDRTPRWVNRLMVRRHEPSLCSSFHSERKGDDEAVSEAAYMKKWCAHSDGEKSPCKETAVGTFLPDRCYENGLAQVWQSVSQIGANRPHRTQLTVAKFSILFAVLGSRGHELALCLSPGSTPDRSRWRWLAFWPREGCGSSRRDGGSRR